MTAKIPKQYRITLKEQREYDYESKTSLLCPPLGFANAYEPNTKAYSKRAATQDDWAYGAGYGPSAKKPSYFVKEEKMWIGRRSWTRNEDGGQYGPEIWTESVVPDELQPIIIDNVPLEGFRIQKSVSRWQSSNKLWRILDPRGFELEINTGTMEDLIMSCTIDKGLIIGPCIWKTAKMLVRI